MISPELLRQAGEALHGANWTSALATDLGVADRTMRRWMNGTADIPPGIAADLLRLIDELQTNLSELTRQLQSTA